MFLSHFAIFQMYFHFFSGFWGRGRESLMIKGVDEVLIKEAAPDWTPPKDKSHPSYFYFHYPIYDTSYKRKVLMRDGISFKAIHRKRQFIGLIYDLVVLKCFLSFSFVCPHKNDYKFLNSSIKQQKCYKVVINRYDLAKCWSCLRLYHEKVLQYVLNSYIQEFQDFAT